MNENRRWEKQDDNTYYLYFTPFVEKEHLATLKIADDGFMTWDCPDLGIYSEIIWADDVNEAKDEIILVIEESYRDKEDYYAELYEKFRGEADNG